jgi:serine/threonine protein kinase
MTQSQDWADVKALFDAALDLGPDERQAFLRARAPSASVLAQVERLVAEHKEAGNFLSEPAVAPLANQAIHGRDHLRLDTVLAGRFKITRFIASGGMGDVYEADDLELRERVAIKTIRADVLQRADAPDRLRREVHLARKVTHPNVCRIFDLFRHLDSVSQQPKEIVFVSMELLNGQTLAERLKFKGRMTPAEALPLIEQICAALSAAHNAGVIHRDLKPSNIVLISNERQQGVVHAVVTDFGLASRAIGTGLDSSTSTLSIQRDFSGTPAYMAPEQVEGHPVTGASDTYSLGLVVYEMITGRVPFQGENALSTALKRLKEFPDPPRKLVPELSPAWDKAILRCLERDPAARFARARDFYSALVDSDRTNDAARTSTAEKQERFLEAAAPKEATVGRSVEVVSMVRRVDSEGLRKLLKDEALPFLKPDDVRDRPFELEFPLDPNGTVQPAEICMRLESPDFEPTSQTKKLRIPPSGDSAPCTFLIKPRVAGDLVVNLELLRGEEVVVSRAIRTRAVSEGEPVSTSRTIVSIPLTIVVDGGIPFLFRKEFGAGSSARQGGNAPARPKGGEFTRLFDAAPQAAVARTKESAEQFMAALGEGSSLPAQTRDENATRLFRPPLQEEVVSAPPPAPPGESEYTRIISGKPAPSAPAEKPAPAASGGAAQVTFAVTPPAIPSLQPAVPHVAAPAPTPMPPVQVSGPKIPAVAPPKVPDFGPPAAHAGSKSHVSWLSSGAAIAVAVLVFVLIPKTRPKLAVPAIQEPASQPVETAAKAEPVVSAPRQESEPVSSPKPADHAQAEQPTTRSQAKKVAEYEGMTEKDIPLLLRMAEKEAGAGNYEAARRMFDKVLHLDPSNTEAKLGLKKLDLSEHEAR